jgi:uncharacterized membrane protein YraQ (UPF0718 family)
MERLLLTATIPPDTLTALPLGVGVIEEAVTKGFDQFFDRGVLGAVVVFLLIAIGIGGIVIRFLYKEGREREKELVELLKSVVVVMEGSKTAAATNANTVEGLKAVMEATRHALEELGHEIEKSAQETRHSIANNGMSIASIAEILRGRRRDG